MKCIVHQSSTLARRARESDVDAEYEDGMCATSATREVNESSDGWRPICAIHAGIYQEHYPETPIREIFYLIDEEPELV